MVFWDHELGPRPACLVGGRVASHLGFWSQKELLQFLPNGQIRPEFVPPKLDHYLWFGVAAAKAPWPFDEQWLRKNDPQAEALLADPTVREWLREQGN